MNQKEKIPTDYNNKRWRKINSEKQKNVEKVFSSKYWYGNAFTKYSSTGNK